MLHYDTVVSKDKKSQWQKSTDCDTERENNSLCGLPQLILSMNPTLLLRPHCHYAALVLRSSSVTVLLSDASLSEPRRLPSRDEGLEDILAEGTLA